MQRLFHRFTEENLKDYPGRRGQDHLDGDRAGAGDRTTRWRRCTSRRGATWNWPKSSDKDCIYVLGRVLEWRQLADAAELKDTVTRLVHDFRMSRQLLYRVAQHLRREAYGDGHRRDSQRTWRFQRRFNRILSGTRDREFQKLRTHLISEIAGRKSAEVKLRPAGLVALEWARLVTEV